MAALIRRKASPQSAPPKFKERRVFVRHLCQLPTSCQPVMGKYDTCWSGRILNISRGGVNVLMPRRFEPGTLLQIEIHFPADQDKEPHAVLARVVHANPKGPGHWSLGCAFPWAITEEDLRAMLAASESTLS